MSQYVETIPSAGGATGPGTGGSSKAPLPPSAQKQLQAKGGEDAKALETIATDSDYGASTPSKTASPSKQTTSTPTGGSEKHQNGDSTTAKSPKQQTPAPGDAGTAAPVAASTTSSNSMLGLLGAILGLTIVAGGVIAYVKRGRRRDAPTG